MYAIPDPTFGFSLGLVFLIHTKLLPHYAVIVSDPALNEEEVLTVNYSSVSGKSREDRTCILTPQDYRALRCESWVVYQAAKVYSCKELHGHRSEPGLSTFAVLPPDTLHRITQGFLKSQHRNERWIAILRTQGLLPA